MGGFWNSNLDLTLGCPGMPTFWNVKFSSVISVRTHKIARLNIVETTRSSCQEPIFTSFEKKWAYFPLKFENSRLVRRLLIPKILLLFPKFNQSTYLVSYYLVLFSVTYHQRSRPRFWQTGRTFDSSGISQRWSFDCTGWTSTLSSLVSESNSWRSGQNWKKLN